MTRRSAKNFGTGAFQRRRRSRCAPRPELKCVATGGLEIGPRCAARPWPSARRPAVRRHRLCARTNKAAVKRAERFLQMHDCRGENGDAAHRLEEHRRAAQSKTLHLRRACGLAQIMARVRQSHRARRARRRLRRTGAGRRADCGCEVTVAAHPGRSVPRHETPALRPVSDDKVAEAFSSALAGAGLGEKIAVTAEFDVLNELTGSRGARRRTVSGAARTRRANADGRGAQCTNRRHRKNSPQSLCSMPRLPKQGRSVCSPARADSRSGRPRLLVIADSVFPHVRLKSRSRALATAARVAACAHVMHAIGELAHAAGAEAVEKTIYCPLLGELMNMNHGLLQALGIASTPIRSCICLARAPSAPSSPCAGGGGWYHRARAWPRGGGRGSACTGRQIGRHRDVSTMTTAYANTNIAVVKYGKFEREQLAGGSAALFLTLTSIARRRSPSPKKTPLPSAAKPKKVRAFSNSSISFVRRRELNAGRCALIVRTPCLSSCCISLGVGVCALAGRHVQSAWYFTNARRVASALARRGSASAARSVFPTPSSCRPGAATTCAAVAREFNAFDRCQNQRQAKGGRQPAACSTPPTPRPIIRPGSQAGAKISIVDEKRSSTKISRPSARQWSTRRSPCTRRR